MKCQNCGNEIDVDYIVEEYVNEVLEFYKDKNDFKDFLDNQFDFSLEDACEVCHHTLWLEEKEKNIFYSKLKKTK